jgi:vacuolar protein sorting-associated protein 13D
VPLKIKKGLFIQVLSTKIFFFKLKIGDNEELLSIENKIEPTNKVDDEVMGLINDSIENDSLLRRDSVLAYLEFKVDTSIMCLHSETNIEIVKFKFEQSNFKLEALPRYDSFLFQMNLGSFYLIDSTVDSQSFHSILIYPKNVSNKRQLDSDGVVFLAYEFNPLINFQKTTGLKYKSNLTIKSCGLDIILNVNVIENLKSFFTHANQYFISSNSVLFSKLKVTKPRAIEQPIYSLKKINPILNTNFNFEITSPKLIIPQNFKTKNPYVIILDFGRLILENMRLKKEEFILSTSNTDPQSPRVFLEVSEDENEDEDEEFHTPNATPPNEIDDNFSLNEETSDNEFKYNLYLNDLQVISGKLLTDNLETYINKGHSVFHLLEKFDIKIKIEMPTNPNDDRNMRGTKYFKFTVNMNLLKLNIDDLKIINSYRTMQNLQALVKTSLNKTTDSKHEKQEIQPINTNLNDDTFLDINLKLKEFNVTLSAISTQDIFLLKRNQLVKSMSNILNEPKSLCELKIYNFNFNLISKTNKDLELKLEISNLILIDARQIYGPDYQLLAASHNSIFLDSTTGLIQNSYTSQINEPLIKINLVLKNNRGKGNDLNLNFSFNTLDLILNPETISEIVIFGYSIYLSLSNYSVNHFDQMDQSLELNFFQNQTLHIESDKKLNANFFFEFKRLRMLMFHIEDQDMGIARKIALLDLNGVFIEAISIPENKYLKVTSKLHGFDIIDLKEEENEVNKSKTIVFTMGFEGEEEQGAFEINYETVKNLEFDLNDESNLTIAISSLCYEHSAKFLYCLQNCLKDFLRFHAKVIEEITEIATDLAINFLKKGIYFNYF